MPGQDQCGAGGASAEKPSHAATRRPAPGHGVALRLRAATSPRYASWCRHLSARSGTSWPLLCARRGSSPARSSGVLPGVDARPADEFTLPVLCDPFFGMFAIATMAPQIAAVPPEKRLKAVAVEEPRVVNHLGQRYRGRDPRKSGGTERSYKPELAPKWLESK